MAEQPETIREDGGLKVIGAGFGRTGTLSLKHALEELGFGPCYHMSELFGKPHVDEQWDAIVMGEPADWPAIFKGVLGVGRLACLRLLQRADAGLSRCESAAFGARS